MKRTITLLVVLILAIELALLTPWLLLTASGERVRNALSEPTPTPRPVLTPTVTLKTSPPTLKVGEAYLLDTDTQQVLINVNSDQQMAIASTTKIMTALVVIQHGNLDQVVTIGQDAVDNVTQNLGSSAKLVVGDKLTVRELLYALMLPSGDDAAVALADVISGSVPKFVNMMNAYAHLYELKQTMFVNADGLTHYDANGKTNDNSYNRSTARDLARLAEIALANPTFAQVVSLQKYTVDANADHKGYTWESTDHLLSQTPGVIGVKTGYTVEAGYCLVFAAEQDDHHLVGVILHDTDDQPEQRFLDARSSLGWAFQQYPTLASR